MGVRVRSTEHEERKDKECGGHEPGRGEHGSLPGDKWRHAAADASEAAPKTGEEFVIKPPTTMIEDKRVTKQR